MKEPIETEENLVKSTIFDDVFRTMAQQMPELLIPLINEMFGTDYPMDVPFDQLRNEQYEKEGKIITDSILRIDGKIYHVECQSNEDTTMAIRMIRYDMAIALEHAEKNDREYTINLPLSGVLYLRANGKTPDTLTVKVVFPDGQTVNYESKVLKAQSYTSDEVFQKNLLFLLPFYVMRYEESKHKIAEDPEKLSGLLQEYRKINMRLSEVLDLEEKSKLYQDLVGLITDISDYIFRDEPDVKKEVHEAMGGQILTLASQKSEARGEVRGEANAMATVVRRMRNNGRSMEEIVQDTGLSQEDIQAILDNRITPIADGNTLS